MKISPRRVHPLVPTLTLALAALLAVNSHAAPLAYEGFTDYAAPSNLEGANGGFGWITPWSVGNPGNGSVNEVRNNSARPTYSGYNSGTTPAASGGNFFNLASGFGSPTFNFGIRNLDVADEFSAYNEGGLIGAENTTLWGSMLYSSSDGNGHLRLRAGVETDRIDINLLSGSNHLIVFRIDYGVANADTVSIWHDPLLPFNSGNPATITSPIADYSFNRLYIFRDTAEGEQQIDDIRFGSTAADVVPVPEPSTVSLLALTAAGLLGSRRSRNQRA